MLTTTSIHPRGHGRFRDTTAAQSHCYEINGCEPKEKADQLLTSQLVILGFNFSNNFIVLYLEIYVYLTYNKCIKEIDNPDLTTCPS